MASWSQSRSRSWFQSRSRSWSWSWWIYLMTSWTLLTYADPLAPPPKFTLHQTPSTFDDAKAACFPGVLASLATFQDLTAIRQLVQNQNPDQVQNQTFWVGLRKEREECMVPSLPLRGFRWTEDRGQDSELGWVEEPKETCTSVLCAGFLVRPDRSLGLIPASCRKPFQFICKTRAGDGTPEPPRPEPPKPATSEPPRPTRPRPAAPEPPRPTRPRPAAPEPPRPTRPRPEPPKPATSEPPRPTEPGKPKATKTESEPGLVVQHSDSPGPGPGPGPGPDCQTPAIAHSRSITLDQDNSSRIRVECWSGDLLDLSCSVRAPAVWRFHDDSPANLTEVCVACAGGYRKDAAGRCVDVDECGTAGTCRFSCLNTEGSFRCYCTDDQGLDHDEDSAACGGPDRILVPVLVAMAALLVLVVLVAVAVKCCLMRRSKERAVKKAEKMAMEAREGKESAA